MNFTQGAGLSICIQHCLAIREKSPELQTAPLQKVLVPHSKHFYVHLKSVSKFLFLGTNSISVSDFSGLTPSVLISGGLEEPRAIALHPGAGWAILFCGALCEITPSYFIDGAKADLDLERGGDKKVFSFPSPLVCFWLRQELRQSVCLCVCLSVCLSVRHKLV